MSTGLDCGDLAGLAEPYRLEITGDAEGAARWWQERGCAYWAEALRRAVSVLLVASAAYRDALVA